MLGLGSGLEEDDADSLTSELEMLVREKLPSALCAKRCSLSLARTEEDTSEVAVDGATPSRVVTSSGNIAINKPVLGIFNEAVGGLQVVVDNAAFPADESGSRLAELDRSSSLVAHFLGGLCSLVGELAKCKGRYEQAAQKASLLEVQLQVYKETAEASTSRQVLEGHEEMSHVRRNEILAALLSHRDDLRSVSQVIGCQAASMLRAASASLYLVKGGVDKQPELYSLLPRTIHPSMEPFVSEMMEKCRSKGRRVMRRFLSRDHVDTRANCDDVEVIDNPDINKATSVLVLCQPVFEGESGRVQAVIVAEFSIPVDTALKVESEISAGLEWLASMVASSIEGAELVIDLRRELAMEAWLEGRYRRLAELLRYLYSRMTQQRTSPDTVLTSIADQVAELLCASHIGMYVCGDKNQVWSVRDGEREAVDAEDSVLGRVISGADTEEVWGLSLAAVEEYNPKVDVQLTGGDILCILPIRCTQQQGKLLGMIECAISPQRTGSEKIDCLKRIGKEFSRHVAIFMAGFSG